eukprot:CAMPEP_0177327478 /NCGR_PEP_ID=MMETSP0368-20130122/18914_1 /TAXON_ID=447022 ORGANISM="Scrippsiella hangoei-like, Strain SHHI-4" /NCGR_SAMPLE_ID=MMETSP0368 /ASSEMBLY_ACC=CAM_ASM_000363 /LENGTH=88 /DNA_ID=CAMNT_0018787547 /DNA_START=328 /DNA_END=590 /DNA_ORIENTATION=+
MAGPQEDLWDNRDRGWGHSLRRRAIQLVHGLRPPRALVQNGCAPQHQQQQPCQPMCAGIHRAHGAQGMHEQAPAPRWGFPNLDYYESG